MEDKKSNQNPNNLLGKQVKGTEKQIEKKISLDENKYVKNPNALVPFICCIRVQNDYFLEYKNSLIPINKDVINTDFGRDSVKEIRKYLKFVNYPNHINYQKEIDLYYNLYRPLSHKPIKGEFNNIERMLKHIFKGEHFEMILTYFWVLYMKPKHPLPFIGLVSAAKGTGKTKFLQFIKVIFQANAKFIDAEDISANFNSSYIDKLFILIDEKIDGKHRKSDLQKYKKLITGGTHTRKEKYQNDIDVEIYCKFCMCSNDIETMVALEEENTRFWIIDVEKLENEDVDILNKVTAEIPAFLYYLQHEYQPMKRKSRLWFNADLFQTERSKVLQKNSRSEVTKEILETLTDYFTKYESKKEITFSANHFISTCSLRNISVNYVGRVLTNELYRKSETKEISNPFVDYDMKPARCRSYTFSREEIMGSELNEEEESKSKNDTSKFYSPDWMDEVFDE